MNAMNVLWLSNHPISKEQVTDLTDLFGECHVDELGPKGKKLWGAIDPKADLEGIGHDVFWPAFNEIHSGNLSDYDAVVVMGELSLCLVVVTACVMEHVSVYTPTTVRKSVEAVQEDGSVVKTNVFKHCQLRCLHLAY